MQELFTIGELAREFDLTPRAIRFYEDKGLISPGRDGLNRVYTQRDRVRLKLIARGKRLGFSLAECRELIEMYDRPKGELRQLESFCAKIRARRAVLEKQREDIDAVIAEMDELEAQCAGLLRD